MDNIWLEEYRLELIARIENDIEGTKRKKAEYPQFEKEIDDSIKAKKKERLRYVFISLEELEELWEEEEYYFGCIRWNKRGR